MTLLFADNGNNNDNGNDNIVQTYRQRQRLQSQSQKRQRQRQRQEQQSNSKRRWSSSIQIFMFVGLLCLMLGYANIYYSTKLVIYPFDPDFDLDFDLDLDLTTPKTSKQHKKKRNNNNNNDLLTSSSSELISTETKKSLSSSITHHTPPHTPPPRTNNYTDFIRYDNVVIVTKIHDGTNIGEWDMIKQSLCLLHHAYNYKMKYPIIIFTTIPVTPSSLLKNITNELHTLLQVKQSDHDDDHDDNDNNHDSPSSTIDIQIVTDNNYNGNLHDMIHGEFALKPNPTKSINTFLKNCNVKKVKQLKWNSQCLGNNIDFPKDVPLQYNWQAEFRSKYVWNHPALLIGSTIEDNKNEDKNNDKTKMKTKTKTKTKKNKYKYKYMMWIDSDAYCTVPWENDPIQFMIENDGVIMFDNILHETIPEHLGYKNIVPKTYDYYDNQIVCNMTLNKEKGCIERQLYKQKPILRTNLKKKKKKKKKKNGSNNKQELIVPPICPKNDNNNFRNIEVIHGFFHITNLDFYRKHLSKFVKLMNYNQNQNNNGCNFMCRSPCDQLAVTLPAVYYAPHKTYDMISNGFHLNIFHNFMIDGKISTNSKLYGGGDTDTKIFPNFWNNYAKYNLTSAANGVCPTSHWG